MKPNKCKTCDIKKENCNNDPESCWCFDSCTDHGDVRSNGVVAVFDGKYGRSGIVWTQDSVCGVCGNSKKCISMDASEEEYNNFFICADCVKLSVL